MYWISIGKKLNTKVLLCAVQRGKDVIIPTGNFVINGGTYGEIYYETDNHNDIWGNIIAKRSFAALNLSTAQFKLKYSSSGYVLENSYSALSILLARCHVLDISGFAPVDVENEKSNR